jgi:hypothetical protein
MNSNCLMIWRRHGSLPESGKTVELNSCDEGRSETFAKTVLRNRHSFQLSSIRLQRARSFLSLDPADHSLTIAESYTTPQDTPSTVPYCEFSSLALTAIPVLTTTFKEWLFLCSQIDHQNCATPFANIKK